jgi:hypothetical protein
MTLVLRVYGDSCSVHAQQFDRVSGLLLFLPVGNIAFTIISLSTILSILEQETQM